MMLMMLMILMMLDVLCVRPDDFKFDDLYDLMQQFDQNF